MEVMFIKIMRYKKENSFYYNNFKRFKYKYWFIIRPKAIKDRKNIFYYLFFYNLYLYFIFVSLYPNISY